MTTNISLRTAGRWRQIVGGGLLAATVGTGLALGSAAITNADTKTQTEAFEDCATRATPDTMIVCCIASGGQVSTWPNGSYMGCVTRNVVSNPPPRSTPPDPEPKPGMATVPGRVPTVSVAK
jgi:hypothetical protein